jgi:hypothetical protein
MFFFRWMRNTTEKKNEPVKSEAPSKLVKKEDKENKQKSAKEAKTAVMETEAAVETVKVKQIIAGEKPVRSPDIKVNEKAAPIKVVIPAKALEEDEIKKEKLAPAKVAPKTPVPEEELDSLLVPVKRDPAEEPEVSISTEILMPKPEKIISTPATTSIALPAALPAPAAAIPAPVSASVSAALPPAPTENKKEEKSPEPPKDKTKGASEGEDKGNLFSNLFGKAIEEEETPLDRLIKSLPDITIEEVLTEAEEVKGLMSEYFQNRD